MNKELAEAVKLFISQPLNNPLTRGQIMEVARIALPILEQQERGVWMEWKGGECPFADDMTEIEVKFASGDVVEDFAGTWWWGKSGDEDDIIAYRIIPERANNQNGEQ